MDKLGDQKIVEPRKSSASHHDTTALNLDSKAEKAARTENASSSSIVKDLDSAVTPLPVVLDAPPSLDTESRQNKTSLPVSTVAETQPMTATTSSSSIPTVHVSDTGEPSGPSPYGTRSRNRTSNSRINYAEDHDADLEFEEHSPKKTHATPVLSSSAQASETEKTQTPHGRRSAASTNGLTIPKAGASPATGSKDYLPGMSSFAVNSDASATSQPHSKKRKAPGSHTSSTNASDRHGGHTSHRGKKSRAVQSEGATRDTNMFSFEYTGGFLKHGHLVADDGTHFQVNGTSSPSLL